MIPMEQAEMSAYLDGELSSERRLEIDAVLERDTHLRAALEALKASHIGWQAAARSVMFTPKIALPKRQTFLQPQFAVDRAE
jgi:anti-sigma factor RsiW